MTHKHKRTSTSQHGRCKHGHHRRTNSFKDLSQVVLNKGISDTTKPYRIISGTSHDLVDIITHLNGGKSTGFIIADQSTFTLQLSDDLSVTLQRQGNSIKLIDEGFSLDGYTPQLTILLARHTPSLRLVS